MPSIIKTARNNRENMKNFLALLNVNAKKENANNYMDAFIMQTKRIAEKSARQAPLWQTLHAVAMKINHTCKLFQQYMQDLQKIQQHYPKKSFTMFSEMMAIIAEKYDQLSQQKDIDVESVDNEIAKLIEESHYSVMLLQIYIKLDNSSAKLKEVTTEITRNHNSTGIKRQYNLTDKEIRLLIDLEIERRQQADRQRKKEILQQYKKQVKEKRSAAAAAAAAKKWYRDYGRYKTAAVILCDCLLVVVPLINLFRFICSGGGLWGEFTPDFSSKAHQDFEKSLPQEPNSLEKKATPPPSTTYKLFNKKLLPNKAANQPTIKTKTTPSADTFSQIDSIPNADQDANLAVFDQ